MFSWFNKDHNKLSIENPIIFVESPTLSSLYGVSLELARDIGPNKFIRVSTAEKIKPKDFIKNVRFQAGFGAFNLRYDPIFNFLEEKQKEFYSIVGVKCAACFLYTEGAGDKSEHTDPYPLMSIPLTKIPTVYQDPKTELWNSVPDRILILNRGVFHKAMYKDEGKLNCIFVGE